MSTSGRRCTLEGCRFVGFAAFGAACLWEVS
jgi:hypothetical protein